MMMFGLSEIVSKEDVKEGNRLVKTRLVETLGDSFRKSLLLSLDIGRIYPIFLNNTVMRLTSEIGIKRYKKTVIRPDIQSRKSETASTLAER